MSSNLESENSDHISPDSDRVSTDESLAQPVNSTESTSRSSGPTVIGAKIMKKLEEFVSDSKENKSNNNVPTATDTNQLSPRKSNDSQVHRNTLEVQENLLQSLTDPDPQKNLLTLAIKLIELQEQNRLTQSKINDLEKRSVAMTRERDQVLLENSRSAAAKAKLESLCRELHHHNQQLRDESNRRQQDDETKREELAKKFQGTIDEITSQLSNYSEQSKSLRERNLQLSEQLAAVVKEFESREAEFEAALKQKDAELREAEAKLETSHGTLTERTVLIKQERQASETERFALYKNCEQLATSELKLRAQLKVYADRYQEFQNAIQQSSQMVTTCQKEIERMGNRMKVLEQERNEFRQRWELAEQNQKKYTEDMKSMEKEKRQLDAKLDKLDRLCRTLQQERSDLQSKVKSLTNSSTANSNENTCSSSAQVNSSSKTDPSMTASGSLNDSGEPASATAKTSA